MADTAALKAVAAKIAAQIGVPDAADDLPDKALAMIGATKPTTRETRNDRRFPNTNQIYACWTAANEYQLCVDATGDKKNPKCAQRYRDALTLCPQETLETWQDCIDEDIYVGVNKVPVFQEEEEEDEEEEEEAEEEAEAGDDSDAEDEE